MEPSLPFTIMRQGFMLVLSSPSGVGKTTIGHKILNSEKNLEPSISVTTRPQRLKEVDGIDYYFINSNQFEQMVEKDELLEHAHVYGYDYGTPRGAIEEKLSLGIDILFDIDWQGIRQLKKIAAKDLVSIFLLPPTLNDLRERLHKRATDSAEIIHSRMQKASDELKHWTEYDYVIVNDKLEETVESVRSILRAERLKRERQLGLEKFVDHLRAEK